MGVEVVFGSLVPKRIVLVHLGSVSLERDEVVVHGQHVGGQPCLEEVELGQESVGDHQPWAAATLPYSLQERNQQKEAIFIVKCKVVLSVIHSDNGGFGRINNWVLVNRRKI